MAYDPNQQQYQQPPQYQQPGYQQPGYQQPGYPPPGYQQPVVPQSPLAQQLGPSSIGIEPNIAGALSYFWVIGLIFFIIEKKNRFVRFHAFQALAWGVALVLVGVVLNVLDNFFFVFGLFGDLVYLVWLIGAIYSAVQAYNGKWFKLPVVGDMAYNNAMAWVPPEGGAPPMGGGGMPPYQNTQYPQQPGGYPQQPGGYSQPGQYPPPPPTYPQQ